MSRSQIVRKKPEIMARSETTDNPVKQWAKKILDYVPAEVMAFYTTLWGIAVKYKGEINFNVTIWIIFGFGVLGVILWLRGVDKVRNWLQIILAVFAYIGWTVSIGNNPITSLYWYHEAYGLILLGIIAFIVPIYGYKKEPEPE